VRDIENDVGRDLRKVADLGRRLLDISDRGQGIIEVLTRPASTQPASRSKAIARVNGIEVLPKCEVCHDTREVGVTKKIPCPVCVPSTGIPKGQKPR
jgi:hypothetical protein